MIIHAPERMRSSVCRLKAEKVVKPPQTRTIMKRSRICQRLALNDGRASAAAIYS